MNTPLTVSSRLGIGFGEGSGMAAPDQWSQHLLWCPRIMGGGTSGLANLSLLNLGMIWDRGTPGTVWGGRSLQRTYFNTSSERRHERSREGTHIGTRYCPTQPDCCAKVLTLSGMTLPHSMIQHAQAFFWKWRLSGIQVGQDGEPSCGPSRRVVVGWCI